MLDAELPYRIAVGGTWIIGYAIRLYYERQARGVQRVSARHLTRDRIFYRHVGLKPDLQRHSTAMVRVT